MRRSRLEIMWKVLERIERSLVRLVIFATILLVVVQLARAGDPVQFYLAMSEKVEAPPIENQAKESAEPKKAVTYTITLRSTPTAGVRVMQNGQVLGTLSAGEKQFTVQAGNIVLDASHLSQPVRVEVVKKDIRLREPRQNQSFVFQGNTQTFAVKP